MCLSACRPTRLPTTAHGNDRIPPGCRTPVTESLSPDEVVDIVDDADRVIGRATRAEVRAGTLLHRSVYILVFNTRGDLFVHERTSTKDVYPGYRAVTIGGMVQAGEDYAAAAAREGGEELGVSDLTLEPLRPLRFRHSTNRINGYVYRTIHDGPFCLDPTEIVTGEFLPLGQIDAQRRTLPFCPDGLAALDAVRHHRPRA